MTVRNVSNAPHYLWKGRGEGWHLLADPELSVIEERMPPGLVEDRHIHRQAQQVFYVLKGVPSIELERHVFRLLPGDSLHVPPRQAHQVRNDSDGDVRFLVISCPPAQRDREAEG